MKPAPCAQRPAYGRSAPVTDALDLEQASPAATDGEIAVINLESARRSAWAQFARDPRLPGAAETIVEYERLAAQFLGDLDALDRMDALASQFADVDHSYRAALVQAEVASSAHRFADARGHLAHAARMGGSAEAIERQRLAIDQACGVELDAVLAARRRIATASGRLEDLVPLGAVLADLERFAEADAVYRRAFDAYDDVSPFPLAWVCFQVGVLWGELAHIPNPDDAALWYHRAIAYLPGYVKARVHLAEIYADQGDIGEAESLLLPALASRDPEVCWRLADLLFAQGRFEEAKTQFDAARSGFDELLEKHVLAFADHAAEFYAGSGNDRHRALELARANAANRPTRHAARLAQAMEIKASGPGAAKESIKGGARRP
jgi:tetratricopeptide (TPR) repeat protein